MIYHEKGNIVTDNYPIFCHQVNCKGVMGAGLAKQIREKYPEVFEEYEKKCIFGRNLGTIQAVRLHDGRICVNIFAQKGFGVGRIYTDYTAFAECLKRLSGLLNSAGMNRFDTFAFPYGIGCGLAGGDWNIIYGMIEGFSETVKQKVIIVNRG